MKGGSTHSPTRASVLAVLLASASLAAALYIGVLDNEVLYDDDWTLEVVDSMPEITLDTIVRTGRGLTYLTHQVDTALWNSWLPGRRASNVVFHALATALGAYVALALSRSLSVGLWCGLLFAAHPVHVEVVASVAYRKDALAMICVCLTVSLWLSSRGSPIRYGAALLFLGLAMFAKEVAAIGLVPMLALLDFLRGAASGCTIRERLRPALVRLGPVLLVGAAVALYLGGNPLRFFELDSIQRHVDRGLNGYTEVLATTLATIPDVFRLLLFPVKLSVHYPEQMEPTLLSARVATGIGALSIWIGLTVALLRRWPVAGFAAAWVLIMYSPVSNVVPLTKFFLAERYLYVPSFGICLLAGTALARLSSVVRSSRRPRASALAICVGVTLLGACIARTVTRVSEWQDALSLWSSSARAGFYSPKIHTNLGTALYEAGEYHDAVEEFRAAIRLQRSFARAHVNLGAALTMVGNNDEAIQEFREALRWDPGVGMAHRNLGTLLAARGQEIEALQEYMAELRINPGDAGARLEAGSLLRRQGRLEESVFHLEQLLRLDPQSYWAHLELGLALKDMGRADSAIAHFRDAIAASDGSPGADQAGRVAQAQIDGMTSAVGATPRHTKVLGTPD